MHANDKSTFQAYKEKYHDLSNASTITNSHISHALLRAFIIGVLFLFTLLLILVAPKYFNSSKKMTAAAIVHEPISKASIEQKPTVTASITTSTEVIGFLPSWTLAKDDPIRVEDLTQIIYFGLAATPQGDLVKYNDSNDEVLEWTYLKSEQFSKIKTRAKLSGTKLLVAIKIFDNSTIDQLISSTNSTNRFISSLQKLVKDEKLDGINLDFEYFTDTDYPTSVNLNRFLETLNQKLKESAPASILSFDVNAGVVLNDNAYDMVKIGNSVDQIILMAYDYYKTDSTRAGPVAPLYAPDQQHSINRSISSLRGRVPADKIILGLPVYGYEWQTYSAEHNSATVPNSGALATYKRVDELIESRNDIQFFWDDLAASPWLTYEQSGATKQIYYEDEQSLQKKIEYMYDQKLGGIALWALGYDGNKDDIWKQMSKSTLQKKPRR